MISSLREQSGVFSKRGPVSCCICLLLFTYAVRSVHANSAVTYTRKKTMADCDEPESKSFLYRKRQNPKNAGRGQFVVCFSNVSPFLFQKFLAFVFFSLALPESVKDWSTAWSEKPLLDAQRRRLNRAKWFSQIEEKWKRANRNRGKRWKLKEEEKKKRRERTNHHDNSPKVVQQTNEWNGTKTKQKSSVKAFIFCVVFWRFAY